MNKKPFLLDSNVFIAAHRTYYGFDFCPAFWDFLAKKFEEGSLISIRKVYNEMVSGGDKLSVWIKETLKRESFIDQGEDEYAVEQHDRVTNWIRNSDQFFGYAKNNFLKVDVADPWLCAYALAHNLVVVTAEGRKPGAKRIVPLTNVLEAFDVTYVDVFSCLRSFKARFVLA